MPRKLDAPVRHHQLGPVVDLRRQLGQIEFACVGIERNEPTLPPGIPNFGEVSWHNPCQGT